MYFITRKTKITFAFFNINSEAWLPSADVEVGLTGLSEAWMPSDDSSSVLEEIVAMLPSVLLAMSEEEVLLA